MSRAGAAAVVARRASPDEALLTVLHLLRSAGYAFNTTTPSTHQRYLARREGQTGRGLRDVFGWNMPFDPASIEPALLEAMELAGILRPSGPWQQSAVRVSTLGNLCFIHSAFPTVEENSVFFGPDTYRFVRFVEHELGGSRLKLPKVLRVADVGCGTGAGGIMLQQWLAQHGTHAELTLTDINPLALRYAAVNARAADAAASTVLGDLLAPIEGELDLIISNPPYMMDPRGRAYRDGGAGLGLALSVRIVAESLARLAPGGRLLLYTGVAMVAGSDPFLQAITPLLAAAGCKWSYSEIDPDVFGEDLDLPGYAAAERIAAVGLAARRPPASRPGNVASSLRTARS